VSGLFVDKIDNVHHVMFIRHLPTGDRIALHLASLVWFRSTQVLQVYYKNKELR
jgi:hypothetical protein